LTRWADGTLEELSQAGREVAERYGQAWPSAYVWLLTEIGRIDEARARFREMSADGFISLRRNADWLTSMCALSLASIEIDDPESAAKLYELLLPYSDRHALFLAGGGCLGSNHAFLGFAAKAAKRYESAVEHFERAIERNASTGVTYILPRVYYEYARTLQSRDAARDQEKAMELVETGLVLARRIGMRVDAQRLTALQRQSQSQSRSARHDWTSLDSVAQSVEQERPDLRPATAPDGTVTIMFSDIENSTALTEHLGDQRWLDLLRGHNAVIRRQVGEHSGFEVKSQGDGFMVAFASARSAIHCAIAIQHDFAARREGDHEQPLHVRIGLHTGEVIREETDFFGKNALGHSESVARFFDRRTCGFLVHICCQVTFALISIFIMNSILRIAKRFGSPTSVNVVSNKRVIVCQTVP